METAVISDGTEDEVLKSKETPGNQGQNAAEVTVSAEVRELQLTEIVVPRQRTRRLHDVTALVESIAKSGLIEPIVVRRRPDGSFVLVCGAHRLEAHRQLGRDTILARIIEVSDLEAELMELDENLARTELTALERGEHLLRRKEIHEQLHPETKHGGAPGKKGGGKQAKDATVASFAEDTSAKTGLSARTIQEDVKIARLGEDAKEAVRGTPLEDQKRVLLQITRIAPEKQAAVAEAVISGRCRTVAQAAVELGITKNKPQRRVDADLARRLHEVTEPLQEATQRWNRLVQELDPALMQGAQAIGEEFSALEKKISELVRSASASTKAISQAQAVATPSAEEELPVDTHADEGRGPTQAPTIATAGFSAQQTEPTPSQEPAAPVVVPPPPIPLSPAMSGLEQSTTLVQSAIAGASTTSAPQPLNNGPPMTAPMPSNTLKDALKLLFTSSTTLEMGELGEAPPNTFAWAVKTALSFPSLTS